MATFPTSRDRTSRCAAGALASRRLSRCTSFRLVHHLTYRPTRRRIVTGMTGGFGSASAVTCATAYPAFDTVTSYPLPAGTQETSAPPASSNDWLMLESQLRAVNRTVAPLTGRPDSSTTTNFAFHPPHPGSHRCSAPLILPPPYTSPAAWFDTTPAQTGASETATRPCRGLALRGSHLQRWCSRA
jgi:hypothetical protein